MSGFHEEHVKGSVFIRRIFIAIPLILLSLIILIVRLYYLQILNSEYFQNRAENNRVKIQIIPPLRGNFLDRNNNKLTENRNSYEVLLFQSKNNEKNINKLSNVLKLTEIDKNKINQIINKNKSKPVIPVLKNLSWEELIKLELNTYDLDGISIEEGFIRNYIYEEEFSHILGYVANPNNNEIRKLSKNIKKDLLMNPNYRIGKIGLEKTYDTTLTGEAGYKKIEVNVIGLPLRNLEIKKPTKAEDIKLTIDLKLQKFVYNLIKDKRASVVVMDVKTGEILSMVSTPSFKLNEFVKGVNYKYWNELITNEKKPMLDKTISAVYPPGSIFKPLVALAALEKGWDLDRVHNCNGKTFFGSREFRCWNKHGHGVIDIVDALKFSCNIFFAEISLFTGIDKIYEIAEYFGVGREFDIGLENFKKGIMPNREWKQKVLNDVWVRGDTINVGIGQGFLLMNPLQMVVMVSRMANGGYPVKPFLLFNDKIKERNLNLFLTESKISQKNLDIVKQGMYLVVNSKGGTAFWKRIFKKDFEMAGKTGTAQVIAMDKKTEMEEKQKDIEEKYKNHGIFIGFAPYKNPKYGIAIVVEHGGGGSVAAVPLAKSILEFAQENKIAN